AGALPASVAAASAATAWVAGHPLARKRSSAMVPPSSRTSISTRSPHTGCSALPGRTPSPVNSPAPSLLLTNARRPWPTIGAAASGPLGAARRRAGQRRRPAVEREELVLEPRAAREGEAREDEQPAARARGPVCDPVSCDRVRCDRGGTVLHVGSTSSAHSCDHSCRRRTSRHSPPSTNTSARRRLLV